MLTRFCSVENYCFKILIKSRKALQNYRKNVNDICLCFLFRYLARLMMTMFLGLYRERDMSQYLKDVFWSVTLQSIWRKVKGPRCLQVITTEIIYVFHKFLFSFGIYNERFYVITAH